MGYIPARETSTLVVQLGYAFAATFTAGSPNVASVGFTFTAADVGDVAMVLSGGAQGLSHVTWATVLTFTDATHIVLNVNLPDNSTPGAVNVVLYRPLNGLTNYPLSGSVSCDLSLTSDSTAQFTIVSLDGSLIVNTANATKPERVGMPVLITDTEVGVDYFGGPIDESVVTNEPGSAIVYSQCKCVGWNILARRRTTGVSDATGDNDSTLGAANPAAGQFVNNSPDQIIAYWVRNAMFDDGVGTNLDTTGPLLPTFSSISSKISDALDQLVNASTPLTGSPQFQWFIDPRRVLHFIKQGSIAAPFNISDQDGSDAFQLIQLQNTISRQNYINRGIAEINSVSQTFIGNGSATSFTLSQAVPATALGQVRITLNGGNQTVGVAGVDIGKNWYYTVGGTTINQVGTATNWAANVSYNFNDTVNRSGSLYVSLQGNNKNHDPSTSPSFWKPWGAAGPLQSTDVLIVSFPVFVVYAFDDLAAQALQTQIESGSGITEAKINLNALNSVVDAETFVISQVKIARDYSQQIKVQGYKPGLNIGQTLQVNLKDIGLDAAGSPAIGAFFIIDSVKITTAGNRKLFEVTASIDAPIVGGWAAQLKRGLGTGGGVNAHPLSIPLSGAAVSAGIGSGSTGAGKGGTGGGQWVIEQPAGTIDGSNVTFTLTDVPAASIGFPSPFPVIWVMINGIVQCPFPYTGSPAIADFGLTGKTLTLRAAPKPGDTVWAQYLVDGTGAALGFAFPLYGSGLNSDYTLATANTTDPHWPMTISPDATHTRALVVQTFFAPNGWHANLSDAQWIGPQADTSVTVANGDYHYQQSFDLTHFDPSSAVITGNVAADNGVRIKLNGVSVYFLDPAGSPPGNVTTLHAFTINSNFVAGINTIELIVTNNGASSPNPSGVLLEITGTQANHT